MSRTRTISLYSTEKSAPFTISSMSDWYPDVRNLSDCSTRRGVSRRPSRDGSSPISASNSPMVSRIIPFYLAPVAVPAVPAGARQDDPDALYRNREDIAGARRAADIWAARAAKGNDFESSWKLAGAGDWL